MKEQEELFKKLAFIKLDRFGRGGYKKHVKIAKQIWKHIFSVQPSGFAVFNYLYKKKFLLSYLYFGCFMYI